ncbi:uncharacterized protein LOC116194188 [Punica granatum]|uniref:Uncharacterized protein n=2 Tax=Punica granatum TaxID=22663 RepID=A0A218WRF5_PUNGR|nr:uncharacterized protein LOC116194188 [Punica granatum]OWM75434.1 hypothetical protein CDL15_Pgr021598 [Punica granatum]PKI35527.1 hypothetical protein CRG98_043981 [Punica granatum]
MWRILRLVKRSLRNMKKSPRVADEGMVASGGMAVAGRRPGGISAVSGLYRASASVLACFSGPRVSGTDGLWASGEFGQVSEMNHLMVSDSMRYAILM